jgi:hypothetical protein
MPHPLAGDAHGKSLRFAQLIAYSSRRSCQAIVYAGKATRAFTGPVLSRVGAQPRSHDMPARNGNLRARDRRPKWLDSCAETGLFKIRDEK